MGSCLTINLADHDGKTKTDFCIDEFIVTEETYRKTLRLIEEKMAAYKINTNSLGIKSLRQLHSEVSTQLMDAESPVEIARIFTENKVNLEMLYLDYCSAMPAVSAQVQKMGSGAEESGSSKFTLKDLLVVPIQRILKYSLLLKVLRECCGKENVYTVNSAEMKEIDEALRVMQQISYNLNKGNQKSSLEDTNCFDVCCSLFQRKISNPKVKAGDKVVDKELEHRKSAARLEEFTSDFNVDPKLDSARKDEDYKPQLPKRTGKPQVKVHPKEETRTSKSIVRRSNSSCPIYPNQEKNPWVKHMRDAP